MKKSLMVFGVVLALFPPAARSTLHDIPYAGGKQTGTFWVRASDNGPRSDTILIDSSLLITNFSFTSISSAQYQPFGLLIRGGNAMGKQGGQDTVWGGAVVFPSALFPLDSISYPGYYSFKDLGGAPRGINAGVNKQTGYPTLNNGYNNVVYFSFAKGAATRYGKMMIYATKTPVIYTDFPHIDSLHVAYTLSGTQDLNSGFIPTPILPAKAARLKTTSSTLWVDPNGRKVQKVPFPNRNPHSLFSPKP